MVRLYRNILFFVLPIIIGVIMMPVNERTKFIGLKNECFDHGIWVYDRIFNNEQDVDIAILGSSHSINGLSDKVIEDALGDNLTVANFAYCTLGRNLSYTLLKKILQEKTPKYLIVEVREDEDQFSHNLFPYMASSLDVILPYPFFNRDIASDIWMHLAYKIEIGQDILYHEVEDKPIDTDNYGFRAISDTASVDMLINAQISNKKRNRTMKDIERSYKLSYPRCYLRKLGEICSQNNIDIYFLYLPGFGRKVDVPKELNTYAQYGTVLISPFEILDNVSNWHDESHLNETGAIQLSNWLAGELQANLSE